MYTLEKIIISCKMLGLMTPSLFFLFLVNEKWVEGVIKVASLPGRDRSTTLLTFERDPILPVSEKLTYYSFGPFRMEMRYKEYQYTTSY